MWRTYSSGYIKHNRSSGISVRVATFVSALLLALLCSLFYNAWKYDVERIQLDVGGWHSRIAYVPDTQEMALLENYAGVRQVVVKEKEAVIELYFTKPEKVQKYSAGIVELLGISGDKITYNYELLSMYLVRVAGDTAPRLLFPAFLLITVLAAFSLIIIIHNAFAVTMNGRIHQMGIFSSVGATPRQIRFCLLQEAGVLCGIPLLAGNIFGILLSMLLMHLTNTLPGSDVSGRHQTVFGYHPLVFGVTVLVTVITVGISAWIPARKLSKLTPLEAIRRTGEFQLKRKKCSPILSILFGIEGVLAGNALKAQKKAIRMASLSLSLSFMAFTLMQCLFTLSAISTRETYFERYKNAWDIMLTVNNGEMNIHRELEEIRDISGVRWAIAYQKQTAQTVITEAEVSEEMKAFGGFIHASDKYVLPMQKGWLVNAPLVILDDESFADYCEQIGISPGLDGAVIRNQIRDVTNPDFRHPRMMPYINGQEKTRILTSADDKECSVEIPVLGYTEKEPVLREEYATIDYYQLVHFIPQSLWEEMRVSLGEDAKETYICVLGRKDVTLDELNHLQEQITEVFSKKYEVKSENRLQEQLTNDEQLAGIKMVLGGFCGLLALIGVGNVFSNTLGFVHQRKREFARYMSVGMTPAEIRKMFCIEALVLAGRPVLLTIPLTVLSVGLMLKASYLEVELFLSNAPLIPILLFMGGIVGSVALAYYLAWRNVRKISLVEVLRRDTML